ncbi:MAG: hypothetical protein KGL35_24990 [Bradyrhizobium sp.]|nr:hypothetical protein [Bradyrhizobium sp.]
MEHQAIVPHLELRRMRYQYSLVLDEAGHYITSLDNLDELQHAPVCIKGQAVIKADIKPSTHVSPYRRIDLAPTYIEPPGNPNADVPYISPGEQDRLWKTIEDVAHGTLAPLPLPPSTYVAPSEDPA